jgi:predicted AAA+ superfamily ATPase
LDEIQKQPLARQAIKYLVKDGRYDYIETGSLLSIKKNIQGIVIPSEETRLDMYPMDYEEFLNGEVRYASLRRTFPENAEALFSEGARLAQERYEKLAKEGSRE